MGVWAGAIAWGGLWLTARGQQPGVVLNPPSLPSLAVSSTGMTLYVAIHPRCGCSAATIRNIELIASRHPERLSCVVLMYLPPDADDDWRTGRNWELARRIPGVVLEEDPGGSRAAGLGAHTSGSVVLYDAGGAPRYSGGVTIARGHEGSNTITSAIEGVLRGERVEIPMGPVFGCRITQPPSAGLDQRG